MGLKHGYDKKIFTARLFLSDIGFLLWSLPKLISVLKRKEITNVFIEKIMTVTTAVNGCVYCSWFHAKGALECGISEEEIKNMMNLQFQADATEYELMALLYAQHFSETNRKPTQEMTKKLYDQYGENIANQIILMIRVIFFGNLYGNTWDAAISRFKGKPAPNSNIIFEIAYLLLNSIFLIPFTIIMHLDKKKQVKQVGL